MKPSKMIRLLRDGGSLKLFDGTTLTYKHGLIQRFWPYKYSEQLNRVQLIGLVKHHIKKSTQITTTYQLAS